MKKISLMIVALAALLAIVADMPGAGLLPLLAVKGAAMLALWRSADKLCDILPREEV